MVVGDQAETRESTIYIVAVRWCRNDKYIHTFMMYVYIYKTCFVYNHMYIVLVFYLFFFSVVVCGHTCHHIHAHDRTMTSFLALDVSLTYKKNNNYPPGN